MLVSDPQSQPKLMHEPKSSHKVTGAKAETKHHYQVDMVQQACTAQSNINYSQYNMYMSITISYAHKANINRNHLVMLFNSMLTSMQFINANHMFHVLLSSDVNNSVSVWR